MCKKIIFILSMGMHIIYGAEVYTAKNQITFCKQLLERIAKVNSHVCVGLDPDLAKLPVEFTQKDEGNNEEGLYQFLREIILLTHNHVACYKLQQAFYISYSTLLPRIMSYLKQEHADIPVIVDCKIGDIDNTMNAYFHYYFGSQIKADGITVNPYMGTDGMQLFQNKTYNEKIGFVLIKTSNKGAEHVQNIPTNGICVWEEILNLLIREWNINDNLGVVIAPCIGATKAQQLRDYIIPFNMPILIPGIGAQKGDLTVVKSFLNSKIFHTEKNLPVIVSSSRGIIHAYSPDDHAWADKVTNAVMALKQQIAQLKYTHIEEVSC